MKNIFYILLLLPTIIFAQYPSNSGQKITLGEQTTADGLVYRGVANDTNVITPFSDTSAYIILDTVNSKFYHYNRTTTYWSLAGGGVSVTSFSAGSTGLTPSTATTGVVTLGGTLAVANGGTNRTTMPAGYLLHGDGTSVDTSIGLFYNTSNNRFGVGTNAPVSPFSVTATNAKPLTNFWHVTLFDNTSMNTGVGGGFTFGGYKSATAQEIFGAIDSYKENATSDNASGAIRFLTQVSTGSGVVEGMRLSSTQELGIGYGGTDNGAYKLQVNSQIFATNSLIATSDIRFKENIQPLDKGLEIINKLKPVKFNFISTTENNFSEFDEIGFIAQDVEGALSTELFAKAVVKKFDEGKEDSPLGLMTEKLIPILVKAIQEQQAIIKALEQRILILENK